MFGLPFVTVVVLASFGLAEFQKAKIDYNATKKQTVSLATLDALVRPLIDLLRLIPADQTG